jgi:DNA-binding GntR family transcriptional regulator
MSRTPIREALVRLAGEGLVATLPNRTSAVSGIDLLSLSAFLDAITLMYRVTTRLAAEHRREDDLEFLRKHQAAFAEAVAAGDALGMIAANRDFHATIADACANPYFAALCCKLLDEGRRLLRLYYRSFDDRLPQEQVDEHDMIIAAVEGGDAEAADRLDALHAEGIVQRIRRLFVGEKRIAIVL